MAKGKVVLVRAVVERAIRNSPHDLNQAGIKAERNGKTIALLGYIHLISFLLHQAGAWG